MKVVSAAVARAQGLRHYFTGKPCKHGHVASKFSSNDICVECSRAKSLGHYYANRKKISLQRKQRYADDTTHREHIKEKVRTHWRKKNNLPPPSRPCPEMCECCGSVDTRHLHLDHDHLTGAFRGWLCSNCNTGIGLLGDAASGIEKALLYLKKIP